MTYRELIAELAKLSDEQLDCDLTVHLTVEDEYFPAIFKIEKDSEGVLDPDHPVFVIEWDYDGQEKDIDKFVKNNK